MNMSLPVTNLRGYVANEFSALRMRALRNTLWARLTGKDAKLARFPEGTFQKGPNRKMIGVKDIPVEAIIGTLYRHSDFDHQFRPLKQNLKDRWINIYLLRDKEDWPPIFVHQVGEYFYVEDGHHRVSVARALGITFIEAKVWEYPDPNASKQTKQCEDTKCVETSSVRDYAVIAE
jgi:hypothetical protein